jgi:hypothetical protein
LVCSGQVPLAVAQHAIASNWYVAYKKYMPMKVKKYTSTTSTPSASPSISELPSPSLNWPSGATGRCVDGTYSYSVTHRGMCSRHGGVAAFAS